MSKMYSSKSYLEMKRQRDWYRKLYEEALQALEDVKDRVGDVVGHRYEHQERIS